MCLQKNDSAEAACGNADMAQVRILLVICLPIVHIVLSMRAKDADSRTDNRTASDESSMVLRVASGLLHVKKLSDRARQLVMVAQHLGLT